MSQYGYQYDWMRIEMDLRWREIESHRIPSEDLVQRPSLWSRLRAISARFAAAPEAGSVTLVPSEDCEECPDAAA